MMFLYLTHGFLLYVLFLLYNNTVINVDIFCNPLFYCDLVGSRFPTDESEKNSSFVLKR